MQHQMEKPCFLIFLNIWTIPDGHFAGLELSLLADGSSCDSFAHCSHNAASQTGAKGDALSL